MYRMKFLFCGIIETFQREGFAVIEWGGAMVA